MSGPNNETTSVEVRAPKHTDRETWEHLFRGYREFYSLEPDDAVVDRVWQWIQHETHGIRAALAIVDGKPIGFAHFRAFGRPSSGTVGLYLDDLFTSADARNLGAARALINHLKATARSENYSVVRWITASDNARARALYDAVADATSWVTYDIKT